MAIKKTFINIEEHIYKLVLNGKLDIIEAIILSDIERFDRGKGYFKKNCEIASELNIGERSVSRKISNLELLGFIDCINKNSKRRLVHLSDKYRVFIIEELDRENDAQPRQIGEVNLDKLATLPRQNGDVHPYKNIKENKRLEYMSELEKIFKSFYSNISIRFNKKKVEEKLNSKLKIHSWEIIKNGFSNYIDFNHQQNTELKYIKSIDLFLKDEMYLDYQTIPKVKKSDKHRNSLEALIEA